LSLFVTLDTSSASRLSVLPTESRDANNEEARFPSKMDALRRSNGADEKEE